MSRKKKAKWKQLREGALLEVGDRLRRVNPLSGVQIYEVTRVTRTLAMINWNEHAEGKFKRTVDHSARVREVPNNIWCRTAYTGWEKS